jgi:hypothetical protein
MEEHNMGDSNVDLGIGEWALPWGAIVEWLSMDEIAILVQSSHQIFGTLAETVLHLNAVRPKMSGLLQRVVNEFPVLESLHIVKSSDPHLLSGRIPCDDLNIMRVSIVDWIGDRGGFYETACCIGSISKVRVLNMHGCHASSSLLYDATRRFSDLSELKLQACFYLDDISFKKIIKELPGLETLHVEDCLSLVSPGLEPSVKTTSVNDSDNFVCQIKSISFESCHRLQILDPVRLGLKNLIYCNFSNTSIGDKSIVVILQTNELLKELICNFCHNLTKLNLISSNLEILELLWCTRLHHIDVDGCHNLVHLVHPDGRLETTRYKERHIEMEREDNDTSVLRKLRGLTV